MPLMNTCCTWLPLRLGSIVAGLISMVQSIMMEILCILSLNMTDSISREINKFIRSNNMMYTTEIWKAVEKDPHTYISNVMFYFSLHTISCGALIYGAFKSSITFILPYVILELIRLIAVFYIVLTSMILIRINVLDFLVLILVSVIGVFLLQILIYLWACPVSLVQCLMLVKKSQPREAFETMNNKRNVNKIGTLSKTPIVANNQDVVYDPLSEHYGWRPFRPTYSYPYDNLPQYEYLKQLSGGCGRRQ